MNRLPHDQGVACSVFTSGKYCAGIKPVIELHRRAPGMHNATEDWLSLHWLVISAIWWSVSSYAWFLVNIARSTVWTWLSRQLNEPKRKDIHPLRGLDLCWQFQMTDKCQAREEFSEGINR